MSSIIPNVLNSSKSSRSNSKGRPIERLHSFSNLQAAKRWSSSKRTLLLRMCFIASLSAAAIVCGLVAHAVMTNLEHDVGEQTYESVAASALEGVQAILQRKLQAGRVMASTLGYAFPNASEWPFVALDSFETIAQQLATLSVSMSQTISVIVQPEQREAFENFARTVYREHGYPDTAGHNDFGFGIWKHDSDKESPLYSDGRLPDINGTTTYGSSWDILIPLFLYNDLQSKFLLFNIHSVAPQGRAMDWMRACTEAHASTAATASINATTNDTAPSCDVVTDFLELLVQAGPSGIVLQPVYPVNDPMTLVGVVGTALTWQQVLKNIVPDYVDGLDCVIATQTASYTFVIQGGEPILQGPGDLHDPGFTQYGRKVILHHPKSTLQPSVTSATYTLTVYPTSRMFDVFRTNSPRIVSVGLVSIILVCIALFFLYDFFMKYEAHQRRQLLDMKRRFVRFISHEIRTPLNCVCMGLELLQDDLRRHDQDHNQRHHHHHHPRRNSLSQDNNSRKDSLDVSSSSTKKMDNTDDHDKNDKTPNRKESKELVQHTDDPLQSIASSQSRSCTTFVQSCLDLTSDVYENTKNAVAVLDDLLNYDKIQTGTFQIEIDKVRIWDMVRKTVLQFKVQAQNKNIALQTCIGGEQGSQNETDYHNSDTDFDLDPDSRDLTTPGFQVINALGDGIKLSQALRNLISNALKFTPEGGTVTVTATYNSNGLPKAKPLADKAFASYTRSGSVCIRVHDTGAGMSSDQLKMLFQEWVQFDANKLQNGGGSGLGLCITKQIIEQHGGTIEAESLGLGRGATFIIELPLYEFPHSEDEHQAKNIEEGGSATQVYVGDDELPVDDSGGHSTKTTDTHSSGAAAAPFKAVQHRILVVEDVISNRKLLVRLLERAGHVCDVASNGQEAIDCYLADRAATRAAALAHTQSSSSNSSDPHLPYDTILMDSEMPVLTGPEATKQLRDLGCTAAILGITGNVLPADVQFFKEQGADEVLPKPVDISLIEDFWAKHHGSGKKT